VRVFDGATLELADGRRVRYIGVDSPQIRNALGRPDTGAWEARDANHALVGHKRVRLEADALDSDADGVLWRYVYVGDILVNAELLRQGATLLINRYPNNRLAAELLSAEQAARRSKRGLWKDQT
jgi:micrococcal nuclease